MLKKSLLLIAVSLGLSANLAITSLVAVADSTSNTAAQTKQIRGRRKPLRGGIKFRVPNIRPSGNREGGAQRGQCAQENITAILPPEPKEMDITKMPIESTVDSHPTFFVNVPSTNVQEAEFILRNENNDILLRENVKFNAKGGILAYTLPKSFAGLEVGQKYIWRLSLLCNKDDRSGNPKVSAWVQRIEPTPEVAQKLEAATDDSARLEVYAYYGFWQETLKTLTDLRAANPNNPTIEDNWQSVLESVKLSALAQQPIVPVVGVASDEVD